jgi:BASS family bile acid:Na+ symporter
MQFDSQSLWLLNISLAIILFGMALELSIKDFRGFTRYGKGIFAALAFQLLLLPLLIVWGVYNIFDNSLYAFSILIILLCPGGNMSNYLTYLAKGDVVLSLIITTFTTIASVISLPLLFTLFNLYFFENNSIDLHINSYDVILHILILLLLPLCLGIALRHYRASLAHKLTKILKPISLLIFVGFIVIVFATNAKIFIQYFDKIFFLVGIIHLIVFVFPYVCNSKILKIPVKEAKAISMELSVRNAALGLFLSLTYFKDQEIIAIICGWWGIHQLLAGYIYAQILKPR